MHHVVSNPLSREVRARQVQTFSGLGRLLDESRSSEIPSRLAGARGSHVLPRVVARAVHR